MAVPRVHGATIPTEPVRRRLPVLRSARVSKGIRDKAWLATIGSGLNRARGQPSNGYMDSPRKGPPVTAPITAAERIWRNVFFVLSATLAGLALVLVFQPYFPRRLVLDPTSVAVVFAITVGICLAASTLGIRLALKIDPAEALASSG